MPASRRVLPQPTQDMNTHQSQLKSSASGSSKHNVIFVLLLFHKMAVLEMDESQSIFD